MQYIQHKNIDTAKKREIYIFKHIWLLKYNGDWIYFVSISIQFIQLQTLHLFPSNYTDNARNCREEFRASDTVDITQNPYINAHSITIFA